MKSAILNTIKNFFSAPVTRNYPFEKEPKAKDYRGLIIFDEPKCIWCLQCEKVCPPGAILFTQNVEDGKFTYHYNPYLCIYCTECVRSCPDKADALSQAEDLVAPAGKMQDVNEYWFDIEKEAKFSKEEYKRLKALKKSQQGGDDATTQTA
jgi:NADH-quinone oxidoreductase subunit I